MNIKIHKLFIAGEFVDSDKHVDLISPFSGKPVAKVAYASPAQMQQAVTASEKAFETYRNISRSTRSALLLAMAEGLRARQSEFVQAMVHEAGKPIALAEGEFSRALITLTASAEEAKRFTGELLAVDQEPTARAYSSAAVHWVPRGPVLGITPFNFPLNLVLHKVAPALACGASVLIKAAPQAPGCAVLLAEVFQAAAKKVSDARDAIPPATLQVISCDNAVSEFAVVDPRMTTISFTGSTKVGFLLQKKIAESSMLKKLALELGGNAGVIVHSDADLERAAERCVIGGYSYAGQSCISVQRIFVQKSVAPKFQELLLAKVNALGVGDPELRTTVVGPLIDQTAMTRVLSWIKSAQAAGAKVLCGGEKASGVNSETVLAPTVLCGVPRDHALFCEEVFGPVTIVETYDTFDEALRWINASRYGLQAGVFTYDTRLVHQALKSLDVGGILVNEVPTYRSDPLPYGGVKNSGLGREGVRFAMEEFSERKSLISFVG